MLLKNQNTLYQTWSYKIIHFDHRSFNIHQTHREKYNRCYKIHEKHYTHRKFIAQTQKLKSKLIDSMIPKIDFKKQSIVQSRYEKFIMSCRKFSYYREQRSAEDQSEWSTPALEIFIRAHRLLKSFMDFYKFVWQSFNFR